MVPVASRRTFCLSAVSLHALALSSAASVSRSRERVALRDRRLGGAQVPDVYFMRDVRGGLSTGFPADSLMDRRFLFVWRWLTDEDSRFPCAEVSRAGSQASHLPA